MSQTVVPAPPGGPLVLADPDAQSQVNWIVAATRAAFRGTPGRLRLVALGVIFGCLVAGFGGAWALNERHSALGAAKDTTQHLLKLQGIQTNLWQADALISNTFLQGGLENTEQLTTYYRSVDAAAGDLATAARASDVDAEVLGQANVALARFTGYIESARANNRQGNPVSINYLQDGTASLAGDVIAKVNERAQADQTSIDSSLDRAQNARYWLLLAVLIGGGLLIWSQISLARVTHRYINLPVAGATAVLLVVLIASAAAMATVQRSASDVRDGAYADTVQLAGARVAAFDAKAIESQGLISRGSGGETEPEWQKQFTIARTLPVTNRAAITSIDAYQSAHAAIRRADDAGNWDGAVTLAVATGKNSANASFESYVDATATSLTTTTASTIDGLGRNGWLLVVLAVLLALAGVAAAIVGWFGVSLRMGEYR